VDITCSLRIAAACCCIIQVAKGLGPIATVILRSGTLRLGDPIVVGTEHGKVRVAVAGTAAAAAAAGLSY
jgi:translation initiation factor IF-2